MKIKTLSKGRGPLVLFLTISLLMILLPLELFAGGIGDRNPGTEQTADHELVIIGGGIAGSTAAYLLRDKNILLLEKEEVLGGRTLSGRYRSFGYAKGTEYLGEPEGVFEGLIDELELEAVEIPWPMDAHYTEKDGKISYGADNIFKANIRECGPEEFGRFLDALAEVAEGYGKRKQRERLDNITAAQWFEEKSIAPVITERYDVTARGVFGVGLDEISAWSCFPEIFFDFTGYSMKELRALTGTEAETGRTRTGAYTFVDGISEVPMKIQEILGDKVRLNSRVTRVSREGDLYRISYIDAKKTEQSVTAEKIILGTPAKESLTIAASVLTDRQRELMKQIPYTTYATVALFSDKPIFDGAFDLSLPGSFFFTDLYDSTWVERRYRDMGNVKEYIASVYIAPHSYKEYDLITMSDEELLEKTYRDLEKVIPGSSAKVTGHDIRRFPFAYPVMTPGSDSRLSELRRINKGPVILVGDYMSYPVWEDTIEQAYQAVEKNFR